MMIDAKPFDQMTLAELHRERAHWDKFIRNSLQHAVTTKAAEDCRLGCDAMIARREQAQDDQTRRQA